MDVVAAHSSDYALKVGNETGRDVSRLATGSTRSQGVQKQPISSQIQEDEAENEEKSDEEDTDEEEEDVEQGRWQRQLKVGKASQNQRVFEGTQGGCPTWTRPKS